MNVPQRRRFVALLLALAAAAVVLAAIGAQSERITGPDVAAAVVAATLVLVAAWGDRVGS